MFPRRIFSSLKKGCRSTSHWLNRIVRRFIPNSAADEPPALRLEAGTLYVHGVPIQTHEILREIAPSANGVVYLARNRLLGREEALKVWLKLRDDDTREKRNQGLQEAIKLARVNGKHSVQIYEARHLSHTIMATMEFIPGVTLSEYRKQHLDSPLALASAAYQYLNIIEQTYAPDHVHGDPHLKNVLVYEEIVNRYDKRIVMKLCDFGTSIFTPEGYSEKRHWLIVSDTVFELTKSIPGSKEIWEATKEFGLMARSTYDSMRLRPDLFSPLDMARARTSGLRDYLSR